MSRDATPLVPTGNPYTPRGPVGGYSARIGRIILPLGIVALLSTSSNALAQDNCPTVHVPAGCVVECAEVASTVQCAGVLTSAERYRSLVEGTLAAEACLPALDAAQAERTALEAALGKQERLTRRARMQRNMVLGVLGGVVLAGAVVVAVD